MATDPRQNVRPGDKLRIAAEQINFLNGLMRADTGFKFGPLEGYEPGRNVILARNNSGADLPRWGVLAITGIEINPTAGDTQRRSFEEMPCITGTMPSDTTGAAFCIAVEPIKSGKIGRVAVAGVVQAKITVGISLDTPGFAVPHDSSSTLKLARSGPARVLWRPQGVSGTVPALIRIDESERVKVGKLLTDDWPQFSCKTITVYESPDPQTCTPTPRNPSQEIHGVRNITHKVVRKN